jgi:hypothetical protein
MLTISSLTHSHLILGYGPAGLDHVCMKGEYSLILCIFTTLQVPTVEKFWKLFAQSLMLCLTNGGGCCLCRTCIAVHRFLVV